MPAYFMVDTLEVTDPAKMEDYKRRVGAVVEKFGGRYIVVGGPARVVEGVWPLTFPVLIEFPSMEKARGWYESAEYRDLKALRLSATRSNAVFIEGLGLSVH